MRLPKVKPAFLIFLSLIMAACANIVPPQGGEKDVTPPKLLSISPKDSLLNTRVTEIEMRFDEFLVLQDAQKEVTVAPLLPFPLDVKLNGKKVIVLIPDSLLNDNTTYRVNFGTAIRDLHESNPFKGYHYTFSTGSYFDSLQLQGRVIQANLGTSADGITIMVYAAEDGDSAVVKKKPLYITKTNSDGRFTLPGLPNQEMLIYALKDANENLVFDDVEEEIGLWNTTVMPEDSVTNQVLLYLFKEKVVDSLLLADTTAKTTKTVMGKRGREGRRAKPDIKSGITYIAAIDTTDIEKRTHDVNKPLKIKINKPDYTFDEDKIFISYDSLNILTEVNKVVRVDSADSTILDIYVPWKDNTVYTLRLMKGFLIDTSGAEAAPSKYLFRTKNDDDYGKLQIILPGEYQGSKYLLQIAMDKDTVYKKPVVDTVIAVRKLSPGEYKIHLIIDENENGEWDTGNLLEKRQPEIVIPYSNTIKLKAGWENVENFNPVMPTAAIVSPITRDSTNKK